MKNNVKEIREKLDMTQEELSIKSKVSRTIISGIESGTIETTTNTTMSKIAEALNCTVPYIFFNS